MCVGTALVDVAVVVVDTGECVWKKRIYGRRSGKATSIVAA